MVYLRWSEAPLQASLMESEDLEKESMRASTTDDNAASGKVFDGFVSVIYYFCVLGLY